MKRCQPLTPAWLAACCLLASAADAATPPAPTPPGEAARGDSAAGSGKDTADTATQWAGEAQPRFDVLDFQIDGNSLLDDETLEQAVYPFLGPEKTVADVEQARAALEEAYRAAGYPTVVVSIPEQDVNEASVRLQVVEGSIETLHISGSRYFDLGKIRAGVPALAEGRAPHMPQVQEQINALAKQSGDRSITPVFRAGSTPGKMEVELKVKDELPLHGSLELNSRNSEHTSYTRLQGSLRYDNLWQKFHSASVQYQVSPQNAEEVEVWSGTYVLPTGWADTRLALYGIGISSSTQLGVNVGGLSVVGAGSIYGARLVKPLDSASDGVLHSLNFGVDYKSFDQQIAQFAGSGSPISYAAFVAGYDGVRRGDGYASSLNLSGHFSFRGLGNDAEQFESKRAGATPNFLYLTADLKHQQQLPADFRLLARAGGQASMAKLISNEQFSAGGPLSVRGYHQTQLLGDHGVNLSLELYSPHLLPNDIDTAQNLRLLGFIDWAHLWTDAPIAPTPANETLAAAGIGLRLQLLKRLSGELDWAYPFHSHGSVDIGQQRLDFRMAYEF
ncbi:ShlB/FhaC/HecB family hemolysin secretion/activation protein [Methylomonas koyamae]|uniref:ShlB/FhaC/HecB family hemolysin secretion/activation protein n=1 Tax=Methylomonas koyamae TaxID=702114 RepID=UPI000BC30C80|nr:ShlB/FhaC/HecB family hemolysin secretion/activation protein [Methylomonas koyamae]ATG90297.1 peptidase S9 [Methylomonas koyamae]ATG92334.1 peptidase S9 [Methylomonas koyamae]